MEIWKDIIGYEGCYQVSNLGRVKSLIRGIILKPLINLGYACVYLHNKCSKKNCLVHRLVAKAFIPNPNGYEQVNHKDENKANNMVENLEWCTSKYNANYGSRNKRCSEKRNLQVKCVETGVIYPSITEAANAVQGSKSNISHCCRNNKHTYRGYHWKFI
jgi:hypothetical protein